MPIALTMKQDAKLHAPVTTPVKQNMKGYLLYVALTVLGIAFVLLPFLVLRCARREKGYHSKGSMLAGPLHFYLAKREYTVTKREVVLALFIVLLGLMAPLITYLIERS